MTSDKKSKTYALSRTALMAAMICVLAPLSISIGVIPFSLTNLVIFLSIYLLDWKLATVSTVLYIVMGAIGLPVFSGFSGGVGKLVGPTGGYIVGFIPMVILSGLVVAKSKNKLVQFLGMVAGTAVCYALGTAWYCLEAKVALGAALAACVYPFIGVDLVKMVIVLFVGPLLRRRLSAAGLLRP